MVVNPEILALATLVLTIGAEMIHSRRIKSIATLAFGPPALPSSWTRIVPAMRCVALASGIWGLTNAPALLLTITLDSVLIRRKITI